MPVKQSPEFAVWDVTSPIDSIKFIELMRGKLGWRNLLDAWAGKHIHKPDNQSIFMPCGENGFVSNRQLLQEARTFQEHLFSPSHGTGRDPALLYISGHGIPGFLFSNVPEAIPLINSSLIGEPGNPGVIRPPAYQWNSNELKYIIFASCRVLCGKPQQALWARAMRGEKPLHGILGYRDSAPVAADAVQINEKFVNALANHKITILKAWEMAHHGLPKNWAALVHEESAKDTMVQWTRDGHLASRPQPQGNILYFDSDTSPSGRVVEKGDKEPPRYLDIKLVKPRIEKRGGINGDRVIWWPGQTMPNWVIAKPGYGAFLCIEFTDASKTTFEGGERIWISAVQVRTDYLSPFDITKLFHFYFLKRGDALWDYGISYSSRIHDRSKFRTRDYDTYEISYPTDRFLQKRLEEKLCWHKDLSCIKLYIPIIIGKAEFLKVQESTLKRRRYPLGPIPLFYLMARVEKKIGKEVKLFGYPNMPPSLQLQEALKDEFQYAVFVVYSVLENKGGVVN